MRKDAEAHADEDKTRKEEIETRNEADNAVYRTEKLIKDTGGKMSADDRAKVEAALNTVKEALNGSDSAAFKAANEKLTEAWHSVKMAARNPAPGRSTGRTARRRTSLVRREEKDDDVIDAEVVEEKK